MTPADLGRIEAQALCVGLKLGEEWAEQAAEGFHECAPGFPHGMPETAEGVTTIEDRLSLAFPYDGTPEGVLPALRKYGGWAAWQLGARLAERAAWHFDRPRWQVVAVAMPASTLEVDAVEMRCEVVAVVQVANGKEGR